VGASCRRPRASSSSAWLIPFGETWQGKRCGPVLLEDPIPASHYGVESLGNPNACYGVGVAVKAGYTRVRRRAVITCGRRFG
jgi:hypothetical protein